MTMPGDEETVRAALRAALDDGARIAPSRSAADLRAAGRRRRWSPPRLDPKAVLAVAAVLVLIAVVVLVGPARSPRHHGAAARRTTTTVASSTTTPPTSSTTTTPPTTTTTVPPTTTVPAGTVQVAYQPFTPSGAVDPSLVVTADRTGSCQTGESDGSYRCFASAGSGIYDPCFAGPDGASAPLVCPGDPVTDDVTEFTATELQGPGATSTRPWAVELADGTVCVFVNAAWGGLGPYDCQVYDSSASPADCRVPVAAAPWWTAACQVQKTDASPFTAYRVTTAWT